MVHVRGLLEAREGLRRLELVMRLRVQGHIRVILLLR